METDKNPQDAKVTKHRFDRRAFQRYSAKLFIWPFLALTTELLFVTLSPGQGLMMIALRLGLQIIVFVTVVVSLFMMTCTLKSSGVFTTSCCVLYRKRKFFTSQSEGICFVVYHISKVKRVDGKEKQPAAIKGEINAAYVLRDGITIHSVKKLGKVSIPPCFTDMEVIRETLQNMKTQIAEGADPVAFGIKQSGLPI